MRPSIARLKQTHGRDGQPPMPAMPEPDELDEPLDVAGLVADMTSPAVDGDRTSLHLALLDAMSGATTWRT